MANAPKAGVQPKTREDRQSARDRVDRPEQAGAPRLPHPRHLGSGPGPQGHRGKVAARGAGERHRRVRDHPRRRSVPPQSPHLGVRQGRLHQPRARSDAQAVAPPQGNPSIDRSRGARGTHPHSARDLFQERSGQGDPGARQGKQLHDKRDTERTRDAEREMARVARTR